MDIGIKSKVVCIKDDEWPAWARAVMTDFPVKNRVYTIRDIQIGVTGDEVIKDPTGNNPLQFKGKPVPIILLEEIHNPIHPVSKKEMGYIITRFAPIEKQKTDVEVKETIKAPKIIKAPKPKKKHKILEVV